MLRFRFLVRFKGVYCLGVNDTAKSLKSDSGLI